MLKKFAASVAICLITVSLFPLSAMAVTRNEVLQIGDKDTWVEELQQKLYKSGYLKCVPTGYFGTDTQNAVLEFQTATGGDLIADGKAGPQTRKALFGDDYSKIDENRVTDTSVAVVASAPPADAPAPADESILNPGDKGDAISSLQQKLKDLEYYEYPDITGYYGPVTTEAVKKFQRTNNLTADGIMNTDCLALLNSDGSKFYTMYPGDSGDDIKSMQDQLHTLGYFNGSSTGYFGGITASSVKSFQDANGLTVDGVVGKNTRKVLYSAEAKGVTTAAPADSSASAEPPKTASSNPDVNRMIDVAHTQIGKPYSYGSSGPNSYDCSGFVYYCLKNTGVATSRLSSAGYSTVTRWDTINDVNSLQAGDLIYFKSDSNSSVSHIGIYLGGGSMIHSAPSTGGVGICSITSGYYSRNFLGAKRVF
ncbi:MAG: peptidoglycan-binding protein [Christensenella sp.]